MTAWYMVPALPGRTSMVPAPYLISVRSVCSPEYWRDAVSVRQSGGRSLDELLEQAASMTARANQPLDTAFLLERGQVRLGGCAEPGHRSGAAAGEQHGTQPGREGEPGDDHAAKGEQPADESQPRPGHIDDVRCHEQDEEQSESCHQEVVGVAPSEPVAAVEAALRKRLTGRVCR